ncbi:MAG: LysR family transcriptional regulator [Desulfobacterales bacterium]|jgi:molybdate transport system regulatory protein
MSDTERPYHLRSKIWIEDGKGAMVFGLGRYRILDAVDRLGSLQAASRELKMSYRAVWCRIHVSEERLGKTLVARDGKGSRLTGFAQNLMKQFRRLQAIVEAESDEVYETLLAEHIENEKEPKA